MPEFVAPGIVDFRAAQRSKDSEEAAFKKDRSRQSFSVPLKPGRACCFHHEMDRCTGKVEDGWEKNRSFANGGEKLRNKLDDRDEERSAMVKLQKSLMWFLVRWCHELALTK